MMTRLYMLIAFLLMTSLGFAQVTVTFQVDMSEVGADAAGIFVTGNWMDDAGLGGEWQEPGSNPEAELTDEDGDGVFTLTVTLPAGSYQYKYANGTGWPNAEAGGGADNYQADLSGCNGTDNGFGGYNRNIEIPTGVDEFSLPAFLFNSCGLSTSVSEPISTIRGIEVAPNPIVGRAQITLDNPTSADHDLVITDMAGRIVKEVSNVQNFVIIDADELSSGLFLATFRNDRGETITTKLLVY